MDGSTEDKRVDYITETLVADNSGEVTITGDIKAMPVPCLTDDPYVVWYAEQGDDVWTSKAFAAADEKTITGLTEGHVYCVRYLAAEDKAISAEITSLIVPQELFLIITAPIFAGDACAATKGKAAGHITFEVPRFQLNGAQEFSMNMSSNQTMSLAGIALASESIDCEQEGGKLLRIIEVIDARDIFADITALVVDEDCLVSGEVPVVYGEKADGSLVKLANSQLTFTYNTDQDALDSEGKFKAAAVGYDITIAFGEITDTVQIAQA